MGKRAMDFFSGIRFDYFGINKNSMASASHYPRFYGIQYISSGALRLRVDHGKECRLSGPVAFRTCPEHYFEYASAEGAGRDHYFVCFSGSRIARYIESGLFPVDRKPFYTHIAHPCGFRNDMLDLIRMLQCEKNCDFATAKLEYILLSMFHQEDECKMDAGVYRTSIDTLTRRIMLSPALEWNFAAEAEKLHVSLKHFMRLFRRVNGIAPYGFVLRQRLFMAAELLIKEHPPVKTAAFESGFRDEYYFSRVFKKYFHLSPGEYRNKKEYTNGPFPGLEEENKTKEI